VNRSSFSGCHFVRLLFGTDTPLYSAACQKARIDTAEIPEDAKRAILFGNAHRLLREPAEDLS
jgi:predicted TIM-barrel fold metal-dependent hydrolase